MFRYIIPLIIPFMHASMGARLTRKFIIYTYIWFYYFRLCYNFNKSTKVNLVKFQKVNARLL